MTNFIYYNNYASTLTVALASGGTSADVTSAGSLASPATTEVLRLTLIDPFDATSYEIIKCTAVAGLVLTITRAQEGTGAVAWPIGTIISARLTAAMLQEMAVGFDNGGNAKGTNAVNLQSSRTSATQVASGTDSTVVGPKTTASGLRATAIGTDSSATANNSFAAGDNASASGNGSVSIGYNTEAQGLQSIVIGQSGNAFATKQIAINHQTADVGRSAQNAIFINSEKYASATHQRHVAGFEYIGTHDWWYGAAPSLGFTDRNTCQLMTIYSDPVNLGDGPTWTATTTYAHGDAVMPTTPNGYCYICYSWDADYFTSAATGATEPTWSTTVAGNTNDGGLQWITVNPADYQMLMPDYLRFIPTEVGFIGDKISGTVQPIISFGINGNLAKWLAATQTTLLTGDFSMHKFAPTNNEGAKQMGASLTTIGTGTYTGRFYWTGYVFEALVV